MSQNEVFFSIAGILISCCFLWALIKRPIYGLFLIVRGCFFVILLYGIQLLGFRFGWNHIVTVNFITALISAFLGIPGILMLYGISLIL